MQDEEKQVADDTTLEDTQASSEAMSVVEEKSTGAIIGSIIIVVLLVIGGLYFLGQRVSEKPAPEEILSQPDVVTETFNDQGVSDEIVDITGDLGTGADFENLDVELGNIDAELNF